MRPGAWHCPDTGLGGTANCDPVYAGLVNQAYGMAKQWARYRVDPGKYNYRAGQTVTIFRATHKPSQRPLDGGAVGFPPDGGHRRRAPWWAS